MTDVAKAVDTIQQSLWQGVSPGRVDLDVGYDDLTMINKTIAGLNASERNEVISKMSDDNLKNWAQEIYGLSGSLGKSEREDLYQNLADGLDAQQFVRLINTFEKEGKGLGSQELRTAMASSNVSTEQKLPFIKDMAGRISSDERYDPASRDKYDFTDTLYADPDAEAVAVVLASLSGDDFDTAVTSLLGDKLDAVLQAGIYQTEVNSRNGSVTNFDSSVAADIVKAAESSSDPAVKAAVFDSASERLETIKEGGNNEAVPFSSNSRLEPNRDKLADAMQNLLKTDTTGIVNELHSGANGDTVGSALKTLNIELIDSGREQDVRDNIIRLQQGNDGDQNAYSYIAGSESAARDLGYYTGTTVNAISALNIDRKEQAEKLKSIFGTAYGAGGAASPSAGALTSIGNGLTAAMIDDIIGDFKSSDGDTAQEFADAIYRLAIPRHPDTKEIDDSRDSTIDKFKSTFGAVAGIDVDD